ncbi:DUF4097 family beta strand repeat-containing protein [Paenibacillus harenae]|uniref:DUF4097 family beta strand repeat-containing protein n=1 Tax=Paenibacillus harenae TaxID=306543 RepID=UPI0027907427|nr:DUF4097 family beta strand repeat-containing protein [Paenibacillus harenae]MDQ0062241.1 hypothetical protein [Paenibacillus harenae]
MIKNKKTGVVVAAAFAFALVLQGCSGQAIEWTEKVEASTIGEESGSGEWNVKKKSFAGDEFDSIYVDTEAMAIEVTRSETGTAEIELRTDKAIDNRFGFDASVQSKELKLTVNEDEQKGILAANKQNGSRKLVIALPDQLYDKVTIRNNFGIVEANDVKSGSLDIQVDAGAIRISGVQGSMKLKTSAGEISVEGVKLDNDLIATADIGAIDIRLEETPTAADIDLKSDLGKVTANLGETRYSVDAGSEKVGKIGSGEHRLEAKTAVGAISIDTKWGSASEADTTRKAYGN